MQRRSVSAALLVMALAALPAGCNVDVGADGGFSLGMATGRAQDTGGIYTCVDAQGRRLTSDRPIRACIDREQKVLNPSGTVRRVMPPSLTAAERAAAEARERQAAAERIRIGADAAALIRRHARKVSPGLYRLDPEFTAREKREAAAYALRHGSDK